MDIRRNHIIDSFSMLIRNSINKTSLLSFMWYIYKNEGTLKIVLEIKREEEWWREDTNFVRSMIHKPTHC